MRPKTTAIAALSAVALLGGCASLPSNSSPHVLRSFTPADTATPNAGPSADEEPDLLLRAFYAASAIPDGDYEAARAYLTENTAEAWNPSGPKLVVDSFGVTTLPGAAVGKRRFSVHGNVVGTVRSGGSFSPERGRYEATIELDQVDGQWRISSLPAGVVIERTELRNQYQPYNLYFFDAEDRELVTDRRWVRTQRETLAGDLIGLLMEGPAERLRPALPDALPSAVTFTGVKDGAFTFTGFGSVSAEDRAQFAAQVVWTLATAGITGPYRLVADGNPLIEGADELGTDDFVDASPLVETAGESTLYALIGGNVLRVDGRTTKAVEGQLGSAGDVASADIASDGEWAAVFGKPDDNRDDILRVGKIGGREHEVMRAGTFTRPSFEPGADAVWTVADGKRILRTVQSAATGELSTGEVEANLPEGVDGNISVLRLSRTGSRVVMVIDGKLYTGIVQRGASGERSIVNVLEYAQELGGSVVSAEWRPDGSLIVGTSSTSPVMRVEQDGSSMTALSSGNISAPVVSVAASPSTLYVTDANAVLQVPSSGADNPIWREVPGLEGMRALPIIAR
ncbi:MtrAB system accessory lipoprotein LpqB [Corynebacterium lujinxingii]|uniref:Lipoprotein LpqB n=1 Tax=Corynebacterium lujinxingii TaxID=2763010 RepID=A0A7H0K041_9CORY|nr:MtrAB system accessory lipoprotein LpqB [Corynebacterium lujinxingii]MBC3179101.1 MtrAB system accessory protein LpqB [Corynebacterium lujinxingii]NNO11289.1 MtrAB system accessory protein LpqB [Corynebacterium lujinxingii]QNP90657.1 MtrAB system accessory protein LpqB [Corynebacterium lujinxingii]